MSLVDTIAQTPGDSLALRTMTAPLVNLFDFLNKLFNELLEGMIRNGHRVSRSLELGSEFDRDSIAE